MLPVIFCWLVPLPLLLNVPHCSSSLHHTSKLQALHYAKIPEFPPLPARFQLISILPLQFPAGGHSAHEGLHDARSGVTGPPKHTSKLGLQMTCYPISEGKGCPQSTGPQAVCCGLPATLPEVRLPHQSYIILILLPHQLITSAGICSPAASRPGSVHKGKAPPQRGPHPHSDITQLQHLKQRLAYVKHLAPHTSTFHCHTGYDSEVKFETTLCLKTS